MRFSVALMVNFSWVTSKIQGSFVSELLRASWHSGEGGGFKMSKNDPRYTSKLIHVWGGEGSEKPKNQSTWFVDVP